MQNALGLPHLLATTANARGGINSCHALGIAAHRRQRRMQARAAYNKLFRRRSLCANEQKERQADEDYESPDKTHQPRLAIRWDPITWTLIASLARTHH
jgi:hypothetical protein